MPDKAKKIFDTRTSFIDNEVFKLENQVKQVQKDLLEYILTDYAVNFNLQTGNLLFNEANLLLLLEITDVWKELQLLEQPIELKFASDLLKLTEYSGDYFTELGLKVSNIKKEVSTLYKVIGIDSKGAIIQDGNLAKIFSTSSNEFQLQVQNYVLESISSNKPYTEFTKGFKELITGTNEVDGKLLKYYRQYTTDLMSKVARMTDNYYADELGLTYFVYDGSLIGTSREFCKEKAGKVFTKKDTLTWWEEDSKGKPPENEYQPLVDMGGFNCRHLARWITDDMAEELKNEQE